MPRPKEFARSMLGVVCLSMATWWWACDFQKVAPSDPLTTKVSEVVGRDSGIDKITGMPIATILKNLTECSTLEQAEIAIKLLLDKTGVRHPASPPPVPGLKNKYEVFYLSQEALTKLAAWHLSFVTGKDEVSLEGKVWKVRPLNVGDSFGCMASLHEYVNRELELKVDLDKAMKKLSKDAEKALRDPEPAENALLISIIAEGATIPSKIEEYDASTLRSPVQHFLLSLWLLVEYGELKATPAPILKMQLCLLRCYPDLVVDVLFCRFEPDAQAVEACVHTHADDFKQCTYSCFHDQGGGGSR